MNTSMLVLWALASPPARAQEPPAAGPCSVTYPDEGGLKIEAPPSGGCLIVALPSQFPAVPTRLVLSTRDGRYMEFVWDPMDPSGMARSALIKRSDIYGPWFAGLASTPIQFGNRTDTGEQTTTSSPVSLAWTLKTAPGSPTPGKSATGVRLNISAADPSKGFLSDEFVDIDLYGRQIGDADDVKSGTKGVAAPTTSTAGSTRSLALLPSLLTPEVSEMVADVVVQRARQGLLDNAVVQVRAQVCAEARPIQIAERLISLEHTCAALDFARGTTLAGMADGLVDALLADIGSFVVGELTSRATGSSPADDGVEAMVDFAWAVARDDAGPQHVQRAFTAIFRDRSDEELALVFMDAAAALADDKNGEEPEISLTSFADIASAITAEAVARSEKEAKAAPKPAPGLATVESPTSEPAAVTLDDVRAGLQQVVDAKPRPRTSLDLAMTVLAACRSAESCDASLIHDMVDNPGDYFSDRVDVGMQGPLVERIVTDGMDLIRPSTVKEPRELLRTAADAYVAVRMLENENNKDRAEALQALVVALSERDLPTAVGKLADALKMVDPKDDIPPADPTNQSDQPSRADQAGQLALLHLVDLISAFGEFGARMEAIDVANGDPETSRKARAEAFSDLVTKTTDRSSREGQTVFGVTSMVAASADSRMVREDDIATTDVVEEASFQVLSLPIGFSFDHVSTRGRPGFTLGVYPIDLGSYLTYENQELAVVSEGAGAVVLPQAQIGITLLSRSTPLVLAGFGGWDPADDAWFGGARIGVEVPLVDLAGFAPRRPRKQSEPGSDQE